MVLISGQPARLFQAWRDIRERKQSLVLTAQTCGLFGVMILFASRTLVFEGVGAAFVLFGLITLVVIDLAKTPGIGNKLKRLVRILLLIPVVTSVEVSVTILAIILFVPKAIAREVVAVWHDYRNSRRCIATAIGFTSIIAAICVIFAGDIMAKGVDNIPTADQIAVMVLMYGGGVVGGAGLVWESRTAKNK